MKFQIRPVRGDHFRFGSVFIKKSNQTEIFFFLKKKTEIGSNRPVSVRFGSVFLGQKPVQTGLVGFSGFGSVFPVWLGFFSGFLSVSVRFFWFFVYKTETEPNRLVFSKI
jgi:hypothetical protein